MKFYHYPKKKHQYWLARIILLIGFYIIGCGVVVVSGASTRNNICSRRIFFTKTEKRISSSTLQQQSRSRRSHHSHRTISIKNSSTINNNNDEDKQRRKQSQRQSLIVSQQQQQQQQQQELNSNSSTTTIKMTNNNKKQTTGTSGSSTIVESTTHDDPLKENVHHDNSSFVADDVTTTTIPSTTSSSSSSSTSDENELLQPTAAVLTRDSSVSHRRRRRSSSGHDGFSDGTTAKDIFTVKRRFSVAAPVFSDDECIAPIESSGKTAVSTSKQQKQQHSLYLWSSLLAGFGSGALASIVCAPMDLLRTRLQVMGSIAAPAAGSSTTNSVGVYTHVMSHIKQIVAHEGPKGMFRGLGATLATVPAFWGMYFPLYETCKHRLNKKCNGTESDNVVSPWIHLTSAIIAGAFADIACNPMFVIRTRMQTENLHTFNNVGHVPLNIRQTAMAVYSEGGVPAFWRGLTASLLGLSHVAIQFPVYEYLKAQARSRSDDGKERPIDIFMASALSKVCGSLVSYPHEVLRSRMMDARESAVGLNAIQMCRKVLAEEGYRGLYRGLSVSLVRVVPNCCVTFMTYELFMKYSTNYLSKHMYYNHNTTE